MLRPDWGKLEKICGKRYRVEKSFWALLRFEGDVVDFSF